MLLACRACAQHRSRIQKMRWSNSPHGTVTVTPSLTSLAYSVFPYLPRIPLTALISIPDTHAASATPACFGALCLASASARPCSSTLGCPGGCTGSSATFQMYLPPPSFNLGPSGRVYREISREVITCKLLVNPPSRQRYVVTNLHRSPFTDRFCKAAVVIPCPAYTPLSVDLFRPKINTGKRPSQPPTFITHKRITLRTLHQRANSPVGLAHKAGGLRRKRLSSYLCKFADSCRLKFDSVVACPRRAKQKRCLSESPYVIVLKSIAIGPSHQPPAERRSSRPSPFPIDA